MPKTKRKGKRKQEPKPDGYYIGAHELLGVADDYLTSACEVTLRAKDATTRRGMERMGKALSFVSKVVSLMGGKVE